MVEFPKRLDFCFLHSFQGCRVKGFQAQAKVKFLGKFDHAVRKWNFDRTNSQDSKFYHFPQYRFNFHKVCKDSLKNLTVFQRRGLNLVWIWLGFALDLVWTWPEFRLGLVLAGIMFFCGPKFWTGFNPDQGTPSRDFQRYEFWSQRGTVACVPGGGQFWSQMVVAEMIEVPVTNRRKENYNDNDVEEKRTKKKEARRK